MLIHHVIHISLTLAYEAIATWRHDLPTWLETNRATLSNIRNGFVQEILDYSPGAVHILGFANQAIVSVGIKVAAFLPQVGGVYTATLVESKPTCALYSFPHTLAWVAGTWAQPQLDLRVESIRFENDQFLVIAQPVN